MSAHVVPHRRHWYVSTTGPPLHSPDSSVSVAPLAGVPLTVGPIMLRGGPGSMSADGLDTAVTVPYGPFAVTARRMVEPASATVSE
jgi:hypothetical protein